MMNKFKSLLLLLLSISIFSCGSNSAKTSSDFSLKIEENKDEFQLGETLKLNLENKKEREIDSVIYYFQQKKLKATTETVLSFTFEEVKLGKHILEAVVFYEGKTDTITSDVKIYNNTPPVSYTYEIKNEFPHDQNAYTQGLEFFNDTLYESTGQYGSSSLRETDYKTGKILQNKRLPDNYFGEGLSILNGKIYQLTWNEEVGLIYDLENFKQTGTFGYNQSKEGWGLCNDGEKFYKSDGTEKIWILDAETLAEKDFIQIATHKSIVSRMNELEWVDGRIYANTYQKDGVAIINPENGAIEGLIDFRGLREKVTQHDKLDVLNGIAWNPNSGKLYVTGKNWDKLFEVEIKEK
ncbi:MAG TPA: glutaminyl-peptide cyclotransferase [Salegentibacter sp.]|uniref:glutaminyl-peptide cyclotransferase n=1 Tax=Salegentibacter sp. TaxID=1903072 RepID=UPI002F95ABFE